MIVRADLADAAATLAWGAKLAHQLRAGDILGLDGPLGAGKTTLVRGLLRGLGLSPQADVPSPTFTLVQTYRPPLVRLAVWHVDAYRLDDPREMSGLGLDDALEEGAVVIEWAERVAGWLGSTALRVRLEPILVGGLGGRRLTLVAPAGWEGGASRP